MAVTIGILTSSRADYSIYYPLIIELQKLPNTEVEIIAFGTHLSHDHGYTMDQIVADGLEVKYKINHCFASNDSAFDVSMAMAQTSYHFANFWKDHQFDLVFCLGDRYEMFAAVSAAVPFQINLAHLYGGEKTEGAIDDCLRHSITMMSKWHFAACDQYKNRIINLTESSDNVFNLGHLSIDNLNRLKLLNIEDLTVKTGVNFNKPTILCTFHPETIQYEKNSYYADEISAAFEELTDFQVLITMPNSDTGSKVIREKFIELEKSNSHVYTTENLGTIGYLSAMKHCCMMVGNTSSGFVEASYFPKIVINLGDRQTGRIVTENIINTAIEKESILKAIHTNYKKNMNFDAIQIYGSGETSKKICQVMTQNILKHQYSND